MSGCSSWSCAGSTPWRPTSAGLRALAREAPRDPALLVAALCNLDRLGRWLLDAAGGADGRLIDAVARRVLVAIYVRAFNVWLDDDTPDLARTLAELDRRLQQAESLAGLVHGLRHGREPARWRRSDLLSGAGALFLNVSIFS